jgi:outer membrane protein assembly factor BamC
MNIRFSLVLLVFALSACSWGKFDRRHTYLDAQTIPEVKIPEKLDEPEFQDAMVIPPVNDPRDISGKPLTVGLPESFSSTYGVDKIVIKKLGDSRWVFLDAPPATVWPKIRQYWEDQHIPLESADPSRGVMVTKWLYARSGKPQEVFQSIKEGLSAGDLEAATRQKFQLRVEPGIRAGSTEVYLEEKSLPIGGPFREDKVDWNGKSDNNDLEGVVLTDLAYYLGEHINRTYAVSKGAENIGGQKAELKPDRVKPVLTYRLPFARAWATVGDALQNAKINVEDLDRSAANYYVYYDEEHPKPGLIGRLLFREGKKANGPQNRYLVHLDNKNDREVNVTIMKDAKTLANADIAEKLLKIIKEYST